MRGKEAHEKEPQSGNKPELKHINGEWPLCGVEVAHSQAFTRLFSHSERAKTKARLSITLNECKEKGLQERKIKGAEPSPDGDRLVPSLVESSSEKKS